MFLENPNEVDAPPVDPIYRSRKRAERIRTVVTIVTLFVLGAGVTAVWVNFPAIRHALFRNTPAAEQSNVNAPNNNTHSSIATTLATDSDSDGLSDDLEALYMTDPRLPDTDGDGYSDAMEVQNGYDPLSAVSGKRMVDFTLLNRLTTLVPGTVTISSGIASQDRERYYIFFDGTRSVYYRSDGTQSASCVQGTTQDGECATLPTTIRTDFVRTFENGTPVDSYHIPY